MSAADFISYPTNRIVGTVTELAAARRAVAALAAAGFPLDAIDVLHGQQDLHRLDPSGNEHGIFARLQRALIHAASGSEIKHLNYHVEDVRSGKSVIMVLASTTRQRDDAAAILHAHGAEFVGFYGRWAYEAIPGGAATPASQRRQAYDIAVDGTVLRVSLDEGAATKADSSGSPGVATAIGPGLFLVSWPAAAGSATVQIVDVGAAIVYESRSSCDGAAPRHLKGTITPAG